MVLSGVVWLALAVVIVGYLWYRVQVEKQQSGQQIGPTQSPAVRASQSRLSALAWEQAAEGALDRADFDAATLLVDSELRGALSDALEAQASVIEHLGAWAGADEEWVQQLSDLLLLSLDSLRHVTIVLIVADCVIAFKRGDGERSPDTTPSVDTVVKLAEELGAAADAGEQPLVLVLRRVDASHSAFAESATSVLRAFGVAEVGAVTKAIAACRKTAVRSTEQLGGVRRYLTS